MKDKEVTKVVFRKWKGRNRIAGQEGILALFPEIDEGNGHCRSYEQIGQHSGADYVGCVQHSTPAKPAEYKRLKAELESLGYNLRVVLRFSRSGKAVAS